MNILMRMVCYCGENGLSERKRITSKIIREKEDDKMKKKQRIFAWMMMFVLLLSGVAIQETKLQKAVAATEKCYEFSGKPVKVGNYYYRVNNKGNLQRSKSKSKNFKTTVNSKSGFYLSTGKIICWVEYVENKNKETSTIYSCKMDGTAKKKLLTTNKGLRLSTIYQNKLYLAEGCGLGEYVTHTISLKGKAKLKLEKKELILYNNRYGQYILGAEWEPTDVSCYGLCIYNAKTKKKISLGAGSAARFIGKKIYYASYDGKNNCFYIKRCNPDGSKKEVLATLDDTIYYVTKVTKTYCEGYSTTSDDLKIVRIKY